MRATELPISPMPLAIDYAFPVSSPDSEADKFAGTLQELAGVVENPAAWGPQTAYAREALQWLVDDGVAQAVAALPRVRLRGLMAIPEPSPDAALRRRRWLAAGCRTRSRQGVACDGQ